MADDSAVVSTVQQVVQFLVHCLTWSLVLACRYVRTPMGWDHPSFLSLQALVSETSPVAVGNGKGPAGSARDK